MQDKTTLLETTSAGTGLKINRKKTELMKMNTTANAPVTVGGEPIREVESFAYLGSVVDQQGGTDRDVTARSSKARAAFVMLKNIWASAGISMRTKLRIFKSNVKSVLLYGCETWRTTQTIQQKIQTFFNTCMRRIYNPMAREDPKRRSVGASGTGTSGQADTVEEVGLDRTHPLEASIQHHTPNPDLEPHSRGRGREAGLATVGGETLKQS